MASVTTDIPDDETVERTFSTSMLISAIRCTLTYVILPIVLPFLGLAAGVGAWIGVVISVVAITANVISIRRFWRADHRFKKHMTVIHVAMIGLLSALFVLDLNTILS